MIIILPCCDHHDDYNDHHDFIIKTAWQVFSMMTVLISKNTILQRLHIKIIYDMTRQNRWPPLAWTRNLLHNWQSDERALIGWRLPVGRPLSVKVGTILIYQIEIRTFSAIQMKDERRLVSFTSLCLCSLNNVI